MDAGEESFVEGLHAIGGEEEDASVVFDVSEAVWKWVVSLLVDDKEEKMTYKTATMALRSKSWSERCSRKTSACTNALLSAFPK